MLTNAWLVVRIILQTLVFPVWALELEVETLFLDGTGPGFARRLALFPAKLAVRLVFLVVGGYHAVRLEMAAQNCRRAQDDVLRRIIATGRKTAFGRDHGFAAINTYDDYVRRVTVMTYAEHEP